MSWTYLCLCFFLNFGLFQKCYIRRIDYWKLKIFIWFLGSLCPCFCAQCRSYTDMTLNTSPVERGSFNIITFLSPLNHEWSWVRLLNSCPRALPLIGASPGEQEADALLACVIGRADVLEHRWVIVLDAGVQFWPGRYLSHPGNGWVTCIKSWNCPRLLTPSLMEKENSGAMDGSRALQWRYFISWTKARFWRRNQWDKSWSVVLWL